MSLCNVVYNCEVEFTIIHKPSFLLMVSNKDLKSVVHKCIVRPPPSLGTTFIVVTTVGLLGYFYVFVHI